MNKFQEYVNMLLSEDKIPGGLTDDKTCQDIADHHKVELSVIKSQLAKGIKVELEHTDDEKIAKEIAKDHIYEDKEYYDKLAKMEESMVAGGTGSVFSDGSADIGSQGGKVPGNFDGPVKGDARPHTFYGKNVKPKMQKRKFPELTIKKKIKKKK